MAPARRYLSYNASVPNATCYRCLRQWQPTRCPDFNSPRPTFLAPIAIRSSQSVRGGVSPSYGVDILLHCHASDSQFVQPPPS